VTARLRARAPGMRWGSTPLPMDATPDGVLQAERQEAAAEVTNRGVAAGCSYWETCNERVPLPPSRPTSPLHTPPLPSWLELLDSPHQAWCDQASFCRLGRRRDRRLEARRFSTRRRLLLKPVSPAVLIALLQYSVIATNTAETLADKTAEQKDTWGHVQCVFLRGAIRTPGRVLYFFGDACVSDLEERIELEAGPGSVWYALWDGQPLGRGDRKLSELGPDAHVEIRTRGRGGADTVRAPPMCARHACPRLLGTDVLPQRCLPNVGWRGMGARPPLHLSACVH
jgi:hypothetical protein